MVALETGDEHLFALLRVCKRARTFKRRRANRKSGSGSRLVDWVHVRSTSRWFFVQYIQCVSGCSCRGRGAAFTLKLPFSSTSTSASILCLVAHELRCRRFLRQCPIVLRCALYGRRPLPCAHHALAHTCTSALEALDFIYTIALWPRHRLTQEIRREPLFAAAAVIVAITCTCRSHHNKGQKKIASHHRLSSPAPQSGAPASRASADANSSSTIDRYYLHTPVIGSQQKQLLAVPNGYGH